MTKKYTLNPNCKSCRVLNALLKQKCEIEETLKCAIKMTKLGIWEWNLITNQVTLSDEVFEITGYKKEDFNDDFDYIFTTLIHPQSQQLLNESIAIALKNGILPQEEYRILNLKNTPCWVRINGEVIYDDQGQKIKLIGTILDVTTDYMAKSTLSNDLSFFESLMEALPNPIFYKDRAGLYKFCNTAFLEYIGADKGSVFNKSVFEISPKKLADIYHKADLELMAQKGHQVYESKVKYADGSYRDVIFSKAAHVDENGETVGLVGIIQDITEKKNIEKKEKILQNVRDIFWRMNQTIMEFENEASFFNKILREFPSVLSHLDEAVVLKFDDSETLSILTNTGYIENETTLLKTKRQNLFLRKDNRVGMSKPYIINDIENSKVHASLIIPLYFNDEIKWLISLDSNRNRIFDEIDLIAARFIQEELPLFYHIFELTRTTLKLSRYDSLTSLMNRGYFDTVLTDKLNIAELSNISMSLIIFDLDHLKKINDQFGHHSGDLYLKSFADMLIQNFDMPDALARIGGDEFACLISLLDTPQIEAYVDKFRKLFENTEFDSDEYKFKGSFSYGIASFPSDSMSKSELMRLADKRMYADKNRNRT
ncbi:GGDEF domain-containing protein [Fusibacter sp. 3D3]|uniref:sensor domain-containing diguanylate cyclase n=1 Tax=Fusibacter sp. 3D3 TaxID=1048380 RepID=UPI000853B408|nr:GGDEF domain-containing protein [Fusibacter sp. 3D3]GAU75875.1 sensory box/GGDEF family protein [Fusibacter sp. 3D3]